MRVFLLVFIILFLVSPMIAAAPQRPGSPAQGPQSLPPGQRPPDPQFGQRRNESEETDQSQERARIRRANKERQQKIKRDTDQLLDLATQLKQYVDKSNENVLSLEVMRKAEEIEKLARQVKDKMKQQ
ncbi:MAG: hypothetical protein ACR2IF_16230 [Terriglobales bacterium]